MKIPHSNAALIQKIEELITEAAALTPVDSHQAMIVSGLHTARDFASLHGQVHRDNPPAEDTTATNAA